MNTKEIVTIVVTAGVEVLIENVFSLFLKEDYMRWIIMFILNMSVLCVAYWYFSRKQQKDNKVWDILKSININTQEDLENLEEFHKNLDLIGVETCTGKLTETPFIPKECLKKVHKTLYFMGVAGSKWVKEPQVYVEFERMLMRVSAAGGEVRFLLLNPQGEGWRTLKELRRDNLSDESYAKFAELCDKFSCLKVRLYDPMPSFRLQFVDDTFVAVSRYKFEFTEYEKTHYGWDAPHLIVKNEEYELKQEGIRHFWSLYMAFQYLYNHIWEHSSDLSILK